MHYPLLFLARHLICFRGQLAARLLGTACRNRLGAQLSFLVASMHFKQLESGPLPSFIIRIVIKLLPPPSQVPARPPVPETHDANARYWTGLQVGPPAILRRHHTVTIAASRDVTLRMAGSLERATPSIDPVLVEPGTVSANAFPEERHANARRVSRALATSFDVLNRKTNRPCLEIETVISVAEL